MAPASAPAVTVPSHDGPYGRYSSYAHHDSDSDTENRSPRHPRVFPVQVAHVLDDVFGLRAHGTQAARNRYTKLSMR